MKIMIVDDSEVMRKLLEQLLRKWNYEVVVATNGEEAWQLFQQEPLPLVLTDWMMPEMNGCVIPARSSRCSTTCCSMQSRPVMRGE